VPEKSAAPVNRAPRDPEALKNEELSDRKHESPSCPKKELNYKTDALKNQEAF
jgi:hypothetical protein